MWWMSSRRLLFKVVKWVKFISASPQHSIISTPLSQKNLTVSHMDVVYAPLRRVYQARSAERAADESE